MNDDDDLTPQPQPVERGNTPMLAVLSDLVLALHHHAIQLRVLAREVRYSPVRLSPETCARVASEIERYHALGMAAAARLREVPPR
jgi:hypothetical protein